MSWRSLRAFQFLPFSFQFGRMRVSTEETDTDRRSLTTLNDKVDAWCLSNAFLMRTPTHTIEPNINSAAMSNKLRSYIYTLNFKRLCVDSHLENLLQILEDTPFDKTTSRLFDLHIEITTEIDPRFLNLYINKLIYALEALYPDDEEADYTWSDIFKIHPTLWLIYVIQRRMWAASPLIA